MLNYAQYLQLEAEWNSKNLKSLHLKIYTNGSFVIFVKDIFAKSKKQMIKVKTLNETLIFYCTVFYILTLSGKVNSLVNINQWFLHCFHPRKVMLTY